jgi:hypothetical protein
MRYADFAPSHAGATGFWPAAGRTTPAQKAVRVGLVGGLVAGAIGLWLAGRRRSSPFPPLYSAPPPLRDWRP